MNKQTQEALKMAIEWMENVPIEAYSSSLYTQENVIQACKEALEDISKMETTSQPAQEPEINVTLSCGCKSSELGFPSEWAGETRECEPCINYGMLCIKHFYEWEARPAQIHPAPSWQGLSDDEIAGVIKTTFPVNVGVTNVDLKFARAIEQALKEKNNAL